MALAVTGSQGNVTNTITNTDASANTVAVGEITVFTTPATSNAMFRVSLSAIINVTAVTPNVVLALPGGSSKISAVATVAVADPQTAGNVASIGTGALNEFSHATSELYVGPSTAVKVPYTIINTTAAQSAFQYNISYHFAASVIT